MPKLKTHKGAAARYRATSTGKLVRMKRHSSHLRRKKPKDVRGQFDVTIPVSSTQTRRVRTLLPKLRR
jgi:large subunit ribosomal protein L35